MTPNREARRAFSLIELLVVLAIVAVLVALLLGAVQRARDAAVRAGCANNLRNHGLALAEFETAHGYFPPGSVQGPFLPAGVTTEATHGMWPFLLPYLEQDNVGLRYHWDLPFDDPANQPAVSRPVRVLQCPAAPPDRAETAAENPDWPAGGRGACADYAPVAVNPVLADRGWIEAVENYEGVLPVNGTVRRTDITDGASNTILLVEAGGRPARWEAGQPVADAVSAGGPWASPQNGFVMRGTSADGVIHPGRCAINCSNDQEIYSFHRAGANVLFADGSVHFLNANIDIRVVAGLITRAGGEAVAGGDY